MNELGGDGVQIPVQELFCRAFEFHEHDAVAELGMVSDDASSDDDGVAVEPEDGLNENADWEGCWHLDVAAAATDVGGLESQGVGAALLVEFDLDLEGVARTEAAIAFG